MILSHAAVAACDRRQGRRRRFSAVACPVAGVPSVRAVALPRSFRRTRSGLADGGEGWSQSVVAGTWGLGAALGAAGGLPPAAHACTGSRHFARQPGLRYGQRPRAVRGAATRLRLCAVSPRRAHTLVGGVGALLELANLAEQRVPQGLTRGDAVLRVVGEKSCDEIHAVRARVRDEFAERGWLLGGEVEVNVRVRVLLHLGEDFGRGGTDHVVDLLDLVQLVGPGEERVKRHDLEENAAHAPHVHLVVVEAVSQQALWRAVPPGGYVLRVGLLGVDAAAGAKVRKLELVLHEENILGLDVSMEDAVAVHVVHGP
mmetsp:Transcript_100/g.273  ORF Transcript_100/g.273 Transcript_100/m.273 type:complete len:315 (-) Transcript_100:409-1353(-)